MQNELPRAYMEDVRHYIDFLGDGYGAKEEYYNLDVTLSELTDAQSLTFLQLVKDGIIEKTEEHRKVCKSPDTCPQLSGGERAVNSIEKRISERRQYMPSISLPQPEIPNHPPDHTTARQVLAMKFLLDYSKIKVNNDKAAARFLNFLIGKSPDNLYKLWRNPYNKDVFTAEIEDLRFIRKFFEDLGATEIVKMINNEIDNREQ